MEENTIKSEIVKAITTIEYYPVALKKEEVSIEQYTKLPLAEISALGVAFSPLTNSIKTVTQTTVNGVAEQLYALNSRGLVGELAVHTDGSGFLSTIIGKHGIAGQGAFVPVKGDAVTTTLINTFNPTMFLMAVALASIDKKLDSIQETQKDIIEFLEQKEKSKLRGNLIFLTDVQNNYKHNWTNEKYKSSNHIKVLDIKQDSEQSILFYREQIEKKAKKRSFLHSDKDVKDKLKKIQSEFDEYQLALYLYSFSSFLEVMLLENFESTYLDSVVNKMEDYAFQYRELYTECYNQLEGDANASVQSYLLSGLASINKVAGEAIAKIPVVSKSQIDETLIETSGRLGKFSTGRATQTMGLFAKKQNNNVRPFIENINIVNMLYNRPMELLFDKENIYFSFPEN